MFISVIIFYVFCTFYHAFTVVSTFSLGTINWELLLKYLNNLVLSGLFIGLLNKLNHFYLALSEVCHHEGLSVTNNTSQENLFNSSDICKFHHSNIKRNGIFLRRQMIQNDVVAIILHTSKLHSAKHRTCHQSVCICDVSLLSFRLKNSKNIRPIWRREQGQSSDSLTFKVTDLVKQRVNKRLINNAEKLKIPGEHNQKL